MIESSTLRHAKLSVADEDKWKKKSHLLIENDSHSSLANLARVADSTDMADWNPCHISEASPQTGC